MEASGAAGLASSDWRWDFQLALFSQA